MSGTRSPGFVFSIEADSESLEEKTENQTCRARLSEIMEDLSRDASEKLKAILDVGTEWLGVENGHLVEINPAAGIHTIVETSGDHPAITVGATTDLSNTYCRKVIAQNDTLVVTGAPGQGFADDPAYEAYELSTYLGAKVVVGGELFGTACFVDRTPKAGGIDESEAAALALLVRSIRQVLERSRLKDRLWQTGTRAEAAYEGLLTAPGDAKTAVSLIEEHAVTRAAEQSSPTFDHRGGSAKQPRLVTTSGRAGRGSLRSSSGSAPQATATRSPASRPRKSPHPRARPELSSDRRGIDALPDLTQLVVANLTDVIPRIALDTGLETECHSTQRGVRVVLDVLDVEASLRMVLVPPLASEHRFPVLGLSPPGKVGRVQNFKICAPVLILVDDGIRVDELLRHHSPRSFQFVGGKLGPRARSLSGKDCKDENAETLQRTHDISPSGCHGDCVEDASI